MCFFNKKKKARKLAEQKAKAELANKEAQKPVVEEKKVVPTKPIPVVEKKAKETPKVEVPKAAPVFEETKEDTKSAKYHVSQNKDPRSDSYRKWRVRKEGSNKTIKFFDTQKLAIEYADSLAQTAGSSVVIHKMDGSIRKQDYTKKA